MNLISETTRLTDTPLPWGPHRNSRCDSQGNRTGSSEPSEAEFDLLALEEAGFEGFVPP